MKCPVCGIARLARAIRCHISQQAQREVYKRYVAGKQQKMPHQEYIEKNAVTITKYKLVWK